MKKIVLMLHLAFWVTVVSAEDTDIVQVLQDINLPVVNIETVNGEMPTYEMSEHPWGWGGLAIKNQTKVPGRLRIALGGNLLYDSGDYDDGVSGMSIRVRGNSSAYKHDKKPFVIKLQKKADLLRRGNDSVYKDKSWLLLKDENLRKCFTFKMNELMGIQWTPAYEYVNVVMNGKYHGIYMLVESVKRNTKCRIDVEKTGYIFEYDVYWWNEDIYVYSPTSLPGDMHYTLKYPDSDEITGDQLAYFKDMITDMEWGVFYDNYDDYIDVGSFASWMLGHDILGNSDGKGSNFFLTKKDNTKDSKVMMGPLWDMEHMFETADDWDAARDVFCFPKLFSSKNKAFVRAYKEKWEQISSTLFEDFKVCLENFAVSETAKAVNASMPLNNERWDKDYGTVRQYVDEAESWMEDRKPWLEKYIGRLDAGTDIRSIQDNATDKLVMPYYNLQGQKIKSTPSIQRGIYIHKGKKIIVK